MNKIGSSTQKGSLTIRNIGDGNVTVGSGNGNSNKIKNKVNDPEDILVFGPKGRMNINDIGTSTQEGPIDVINLGDGDVSIGSGNGNGNDIDNQIGKFA